EPERLAVAVHVAEHLEGAQEATRRRARHLGPSSHLGEAQFGMHGVERPDHREAPGERLHEVVAHRSSTIASPCPTPMQIAATATPPPRRTSACAAWAMIRPPEAPSGWPIAIAPPWMLTRSGSSSGHSCRHARLCEAKASLSSSTST